MTRKFFAWLPRRARTATSHPARARRVLPTLERLEERTLLDAAPDLLLAPEKFLDAVYRDVLGRPADASGLATWGGLLRQGTEPGAVAGAILNSAEAHRHTLDELYTVFLGRPVDEAGRAFFTAFLDHGGTREQVEAALLASPEYGQRAGGSNAGFLDAAY